MATIIAIANQKGGVGKTTTAINLGFALTGRDKAVLMIDADPQASLTGYLGYDPDEFDDEERTLYFALLKGRPLASLLVGDNPALIPSSIRLANAENEIFREVFESPQVRLRSLLDDIRDRFDIILIDCSPSLGIVTVNALVAADQVLIPAQTEYLASKGIGLLLESIARTRVKLNPSLKILGVLPTMFDARTKHHQEVLLGVREGMVGHGIPVFDPIARSIAFSSASLQGKPTIVLQPHAPSVESYQRLADVVARTG